MVEFAPGTKSGRKYKVSTKGGWRFVNLSQMTSGSFRLRWLWQALGSPRLGLANKHNIQGERTNSERM